MYIKGISFVVTTRERKTNSVLARPIPKGTVLFGAANVPFGAGPKPKCALWCFSSHLNCLHVRVTVLCWKQALA